VFFHVSAINRRKVRIGDRVSFELSSDKHRRRCATNMRVVANEEGAQAEERQQMTADYDREERSALAQALRRAAGGEQA
jgi:hypothetical protein